MRTLIRLRTLLLLLVLISTSRTQADWPCRSDSALSISTDSGNQWNVRLTTDGSSGSFLAWQDRRGGVSDKIFIQHMSATGNAVWTAGGLALAQTSGFQYYPQIMYDGSGGFFIVWQDNRSGLDYDIFIQRVTSSGAALWTTNGDVVCDASGHQYNPQLVSDGLQGVIVTWQDRRSGNFEVYAQRFDANGNSKWTSNGQLICNAVNDQIEPKLVADGASGAVISWLDYRGGSGHTDIYAQHINSIGTVTWTGNGVPVCVAPNLQWNHQMVEGGVGQSILVWQDRRSTNYDNIFAQKLSASGLPVWTENGIPLALASAAEYYPQAVSDENGGAVVVWQHNRTGADYNILGQRVSSDGDLLWLPAGLPICEVAGHQYNPQIVSQGTDVIVTWQDKRGTDFDIFAQRLGMAGNTFWDNGGVPLISAPQDQFAPAMVSDLVHGAIITWTDYRLGTGSTDIFAHRIGANGLPGGGCFRTFSQDGFGLTPVRFRNRGTPFKVVALPNEGNIRDSIFARGAFAQGIVVGVERLDSSRYYGWEYFTRAIYVRRAFPQNGAARPFDRIFEHKFTGMLKNPAIWRYNNRLSGEILALRLNIGASEVGLTPPNLGDMLFRDTSSVPNPLSNLTLRQVAAKADTAVAYWKRYPADYARYYATLKKIDDAFVAPIDTISTRPLRLKSTKAMFSVPYLIPNTTIMPAPPGSFQPTPYDIDEPNAFSLLQNYPNPFNPITTIEFTLMEPSVVSLIIYNVLGQQIARLVDHATMDEGRQVLDFDASAVASGVYFYQLLADPISGQGKFVSQVRKMVLLK